ncbi:MAG: transglutaminase-like cysteine peptidase [Pseudomonadota bacterium]
MSNELYCRQLLSILAIALALCVGFFCGSANAAPLGTATFSAFRAMAEPFGIGASELKQGSLFDKWRSITQALPGEIAIVAQCREDMDACPAEAKRFIAVLDKALAREGFAQIAEINRSINLNIRPIDDLTLYGVNEFWATPLTTFANGAGDCEDYAIAKYVALRLIGISEDDVRLVVVYDRNTHEHHAVASVRHNERWLVLDNRTLAIQDDAEVAQFDPLFVLNGQGVRRLAAAPRKIAPLHAGSETAAIAVPMVSSAPTTPFLL